MESAPLFRPASSSVPPPHPPPEDSSSSEEEYQEDTSSSDEGETLSPQEALKLLVEHVNKGKEIKRMKSFGKKQRLDLLRIERSRRNTRRYLMDLLKVTPHAISIRNAIIALDRQIGTPIAAYLSPEDLDYPDEMPELTPLPATSEGSSVAFTLEPVRVFHLPRGTTVDTIPLPPEGQQQVVDLQRSHLEAPVEPGEQPPQGPASEERENQEPGTRRRGREEEEENPDVEQEEEMPMHFLPFKKRRFFR